MKKISFLLFAFLLINHSFSQTTAARDSSKSDSIRIKTAAWKSYIEKKIDNNVPANNGAPAGTYTVVVRFIEDKNGTASQITPETSIGYGMEAEVVRVLRKSITWAPAQQERDLSVKQYYHIPIVFTVTKENKKNKKNKHSRSKQIDP